MAALKKRSSTELEQDNRQLNYQMHEMGDEAKHLKEELKSLSQQKSAMLIEVQQLRKDNETMSRELKEAREREQVATKQAEDSEKKIEKVSSHYNEKKQTLELRQDCSRLQIEVSKLQVQIEKKNSVILEKQEEVRAQQEAIKQLELSQSRTKVDYGTRASNIECALVQSKNQCTALVREVGTISSEKWSLLNGYEKLRSDLEKVSSPQNCPSSRDAVNCKNSPGLCRKAASDTNLMSSTSSPSSVPLMGHLTMDRDISTIMSDYRRMEQDHQCLLSNFQQTTLKLDQLKKSTKQKEVEIASLQTVNCKHEDRIKQLEEKVQTQNSTANVLTTVANPESIKEVFECKTHIHNLEADLEVTRKEYHTKNSAVIKKQAVIDELTAQLKSMDSESICNLQSKFQDSEEQVQSLTQAVSVLKTKESAGHREAAVEVQQLQDKLDIMTRDKYALEDLLDTASEDYEELQAESTALKDENKGLTDSYSELKLALERHQSTIDKDVQQRTESLQEKLDLALSERQQLQSQYNAAKVQIKKVRELEQLLKEKNKSHASLVKDFEMKEATISELRESLKEFRNGVGVSKTLKRVSTLEQRVGSFQKANSQAVDSFRHLLQETECVEMQKFELLSILEEKSKAEGHLHKMVNELTEENHGVVLYVQKLEKVVEANNVTFTELKNTIYSLEEALALSRDDYNRTSHTLSSVRSDYIELQFAQKQLEEHNYSLHNAVQLQSDENSKLCQELQNYKQRNERLKSELNRQRALLDEAKKAVLSFTPKKSHAMNECI